jgi:peptidoglycan/xylan/chitin deacetylase (PgdA/CDA1 family)
VANRWHWDFEDDERARVSSTAARPPEPPAPSPPGGGEQGGSRRVLIRRRRAVALIAVLAGLVIVAIALLSQGSGSAARRGRGLAAGTAPRNGPAPAVQPENDKQAAVSSVLAYTPFIKEGTARKPEVALTFDDGPGPYTPGVLSVLERYGVHATFFIIGRMLQYFSESARREVRDGDVLGDHTQTHPAMARLSAHDQYEQIFEQAARVELQGARRPDLFRPPYGSFDATTMAQLARLHMLMVLWSVDTDDYAQPGVGAIVQRALEGAHPGAIILMHDAGGTRTETVEALPIIIRALRARGLKPVTVPQLLADDPPAPGQPLPTSLAGD